MSDSEYPKNKRRFDHGGFVVYATKPLERNVHWRCPNCGGNCFGTSMGVRYCGGHSYGTPTEQSSSCGYWEDDSGNRGVR